MVSVMKGPEAELWLADNGSELCNLLDLTDRLDRLAVAGGRDAEVLKTIDRIRDQMRDVRRRSIPKRETVTPVRRIARASGGRLNVVHIAEGSRAICGLEPVRGFTDHYNLRAKMCLKCKAEDPQRDADHRRAQRQVAG